MDILESILIGGAGGAIAGITVKTIQFINIEYKISRDKRKIYNWLKSNTSSQSGEKFRSTRAIASYNNLTEDRVRFICSLHPSIHLSTGENEDFWSLHTRGEESEYENRDGLFNI
ncbi:hypothetical protein JYB64_07050 [Algoriphagus aestuarii]|nr:hypothetical protein [Algoriphagus aestuarii]